MSKYDKMLVRILRGTSDANIAFSDMRQFLVYFGFQERVRGSHHIFFRDGISEILNLQPRGTKAKSYQVKQVRNLILKYRLAGDDHAEV
jgi:hypothetical protein